MKYDEYIKHVQSEYYQKLFQVGKLTPFLEDKLYDWIENYQKIYKSIQDD